MDTDDNKSTNSKDKEKFTKEDLNLIQEDIKNFEQKMKFKLERQIGRGGYSIVYLGRNESIRPYAVKINFINPNKELDKRNKNYLISRNERIISMNLKNKNCIKCYNTTEINNSQYLILEYANKGDLANLTSKFYRGELFQLLNYPKFMQNMSESLIKFFFIQIVESLDYLRKMNIVHRDLKLENLLICGNNNSVKLSDFALAFQNSIYGTYENTYIGTPVYMPPEIHFKSEIKNEETFKFDYYALGVILYKMLYGKFFCKKEENDKFDKEKLIEELDRIKLENVIINDINELMKSLIEKDITLRADFSDIRSSKWLNNLDNLDKIGNLNEINQNDYLKFLIELQKLDYYSNECKNNLNLKTNIKCEKEYQKFIIIKSIDKNKNKITKIRLKNVLKIRKNS